ncbi:putative ABC transporter, ATP-binding protein SagG [Clostridiales bacterium oral taxon 876 str. F0540]|nr:putative ABC transporter, ATP-binding protein SagG [Clostridiales bacterium oral taxon 876 str. F0540]
MAFIEINNITKRFNDKLAIDNVSMEVEEGDIFGLLGPNGAGKSTLISTIVGLIKSDNGDITVGGYSINKESLKVKEQIGLVPQEIALYEKLSAKQNLEFWGAMYGLKGKLLKQRVDEGIELSGLQDSIKMPVKKYSGGMKRRLNIACAVLHHPKVLIMDEPTVGIDPQSRNHIFEFTKNINKENGTTVIYTSHYMEEIEALCNRLFILDLGKEIAKGSKAEVKRMVTDLTKVDIQTPKYNEEIVLKLKKVKGINEVVKEEGKLTLVTKNESFSLEEAVRILIAEGVKFNSIHINEPTLEEVFLTLTGKKLRD